MKVASISLPHTCVFSCFQARGGLSVFRPKLIPPQPSHNSAVEYMVPDSPRELRTNVTFSFIYGSSVLNGTRPLAMVFNDLGVNSNWYTTLAQAWADQGFVVAVFDFYKPLFLPTDAAQQVLGVPRTLGGGFKAQQAC